MDQDRIEKNHLIFENRCTITAARSKRRELSGGGPARRRPRGIGDEPGPTNHGQAEVERRVCAEEGDRVDDASLGEIGREEMERLIAGEPFPWSTAENCFCEEVQGAAQEGNLIGGPGRAGREASGMLNPSVKAGCASARSL